MILDDFKRYIGENCSAESNLPGSYVRALKYGTQLLQSCIPAYSNLPNIWEITSLETLAELYACFKGEQNKKNDSAFAKSSLPPSYWQHRYCSNAIKMFARFLNDKAMEGKAMSVFESETDPKKVSASISAWRIKAPELFLDDDDINIATREGKDKIREVRQRQNQSVFRKMILRNFQYACCITGLTVPETLRASHIVGWAENAKTRLLPTNGLCLSATYDAAFDRHLISFDDDYRMILSPMLKAYVSNGAFVEIFKRYEGRKLIPGIKFQPSLSFLRQHRNQMIVQSTKVVP